MSRPTQKQVAQRAGVSQTVVSQVLNGQTEQARIHPETRQRVQQAIDALGYVPNVAARRLVGGSSSLIGVFTYEAVFPSSTRDFYAPLLEGIEQEASQADLDLLLYTSGSHTRTGRRQPKRRLSESVRGRLPLTDGTILLGNPDEQDRLELAELVQTGHPLVFIGRREIPGVTVRCVEADYAAATASLTRRFQALGHQQLCYLGGLEGSESALDRQRGFQEAAPGNPVRRLSLTDLTPDFLQEQRAAGTTGYLVENDELMRRLLTLARPLKFQVPADLSVAVLGDAITGKPHEQHWTRFEIPRQQMGRGAVRALRQMLTGQGSAPERLACRLVEGRTLDRAPT